MMHCGIFDKCIVGFLDGSFDNSWIIPEYVNTTAADALAPFVTTSSAAPALTM